MCRKPLLGIPLSNDQKTNLFDAENRGIAHVLPWKGLSKETFLSGIHTVLNDDKNRCVLSISSISIIAFLIMIITKIFEDYDFLYLDIKLQSIICMI